MKLLSILMIFRCFNSERY